MEATAYVVHRVPGRLRIRVPSKKGDTVYFGAVKEALTSLEGVEDVVVSPSTGSILVHGRALAEDAIERARSQGFFVLKEKPTAEATTFHDAVAGQFRTLNERVRDLTGSSFDLPALAFVCLVGAGIYQIFRGNFTAPAWYTAFWYALGIFGKSPSGKGSRENDRGSIE
jgi:copper chaperone CopZ